MKILLIAGHGAGDPGATVKFRGKTYKEAEETRSILSDVTAALSDYDVEIGWYNTDRNAYLDWKAGKLPASVFEGCVIVVEVHLNAFKLEGAENGKTKGVECYVPTSVSIIGDAVAALLCEEIAKLGLTNRGVKKKNYSVIAAARAAGVPAVLLECFFLDDADDMKVYTQNKSAVANAIAAALVKSFNLKALPKTSREIVQQAAGLADSTMDYLAAYRWGKDLLDKLAAAIKNN